MIPRGPYRMPGRGRDGTMVARGGTLVRLLHAGDQPVVVRAWPTRAGVRFEASARERVAAAWGIERMRFALGVDHDVSEFHRRFRGDSLLGPAIRRRPWLRPRRRPVAFEALLWAITEQLIESDRAARIQRRLVRGHGREASAPAGWADWSLRDAPTPAAVAALAPARLCSYDLAPKRALAMIRVAKEVASGRADLDEHEPAWRRLRSIPEIGSWTLECLALHGQGRDDQLPAGDLAYVKLIGRLERLGRRADEHEVRAWFERYAPFQALAGQHLLADRHRLLAGSPPIFAAASQPAGNGPPGRRRPRGPAPAAARW